MTLKLLTKMFALNIFLNKISFWNKAVMIWDCYSSPNQLQHFQISDISYYKSVLFVTQHFITRFVCIQKI